jgi:hypothetical protein
MASHFTFICTCGASRIYGCAGQAAYSNHGKVEPARPNPLEAWIKCESCGKVTRHTFLGLHHYDGRGFASNRYLSKRLT